MESSSLAAALVALLVAPVAHWALGRTRHRLPVVLAQRAGGPDALPDARLVRYVALAVLLAEAVVWTAAVATVVETVPPLRDAIVGGAAMALRMPVIGTDAGRYALGDLLLLAALLAGVWAAGGGLVGLLKARVLEVVGVDRGVQEAIGTILRIALTTAGSLLLLQAWGVDLRTLAIGASVLGVGIGFGLQNIANNFVSGLLIGLERPVKPGDFVEVDGIQGTVQRVGSRSTAIRTLDHVTILVPNARLLEHVVVNWSHAAGAVRIRVPVGVAYGSPVATVRAALLDVAREHPSVLDEPRPRVELHAFGGSALEFELQVWTRTPQQQHVLRSDLNYRIEAGLRRHGISIPFPQHDVHVRSPRLEGLLAAAAAQWFPDVPAVDTPRGAEAEETPFGGDLGGRTWTDAELARVAEAMRAPDGVEVRDRRHRLTVYPHCFVGSEAVTWLTRHEDVSRETAVLLGQALIARGLLRHVLGEHGFRDANLFYRFRDEAAAPATPAMVPAADGARAM